ncbi:uncharacterized protein GGS25DRAFT_506347 [Hypoxylon fragiforme]|uniref:uncharacterized protein n=1 Tax=Hypoxylon fragiforme TaxID=63214 RepID=UPI0020C5F976|nr:uncharacterized protein GGS25DRAFT_506347 [Hypoxylon fragiforme]KAI2603974.1 hypothetical protein GGS25DRAFT_506347 [Hypoxylon fragiforme]
MTNDSRFEQDHYGNHWPLQYVLNYDRNPTQAESQLLQLPRQNDPHSSWIQTPHPAHSRQVQRVAYQLSKKTLSQYLDVTPAPLPLPRFGAHLESLPQNVLDRICSYVPYEHLLTLYQLSKTLHRVVNPYLAPYDTILSFVLRAERDFEKHYKNEQFLGCYMCYKVLPASLFAVDQPLQALLRVSPFDEQSLVNLRRFCILCGVKWGCHSPGKELTTRTGERFWICDCFHVHNDGTPGCKECKAPSPLEQRGPRRRK